MDEMMTDLQFKDNLRKDGASLRRRHLLFQLLQGEGAYAALQFPVDKEPHGRGFHASLLHPLFGILIHGKVVGD